MSVYRLWVLPTLMLTPIRELYDTNEERVKRTEKIYGILQF